MQVHVIDHRIIIIHVYVAGMTLNIGRRLPFTSIYKHKKHHPQNGNMPHLPSFIHRLHYYLHFIYPYVKETISLVLCILCVRFLLFLAFLPYSHNPLPNYCILSCLQQMTHFHTYAYLVCSPSPKCHHVWLGHLCNKPIH